MSSWGMLGAGLSAMGDTLGKYAMQRISSDEALAREKQLADYKIEMQEKLEARAAETYAKRVGAARTSAQGAFQGRIDEQTNLPGLLSLQRDTEAAWKDRLPPGGPVVRAGDQVTQETALQDLTKEDRGILRANIAENVEYAKSLKPSAAQLDQETYRQLRMTDATTAEKFGKELKTEAEITKALRPEKAETKFFHRERTGEITAVTPDGAVIKVKEGKEPPKSSGDKPSADEKKADKAVARLNSIRVHDVSGAVRKMTSQEFATLASWANIEGAPGKDFLAKPEVPAWVRDTINGLGGLASARELLKEAGQNVPDFYVHKKDDKKTDTPDLNKYRTK